MVLLQYQFQRRLKETEWEKETESAEIQRFLPHFIILSMFLESHSPLPNKQPVLKFLGGIVSSQEEANMKTVTASKMNSSGCVVQLERWLTG